MFRRVSLLAVIMTGATLCCVPAVHAATTGSMELSTVIRSEGKPVTFMIKNADAVTALSQLSKTIGTPIILKQPSTQTVDFNFTETSVSKIMDEVSDTLGCRWEREYTIYKIQSGQTTAENTLVSGRTVSLDVKDTPFPVVAKMIVRAAKGTVKVDSSLSSKVNLAAANMPVEKALDTICSGQNAGWKMQFVLIPAPKTETKTEPTQTATTTKKEPITRVVSADKVRDKKKVQQTQTSAEDAGGIPGPKMFPNPEPVTDMFGMGDNSATQFAKSIKDLFALTSDKRASQIKEVASRLKDVVSYVDSSSSTAQNRFYGNMLPALRNAYNQIAQMPADRQAELKPITDAISTVLKSKSGK